MQNLNFPIYQNNMPMNIPIKDIIDGGTLQNEESVYK